MSGFKWTFTPQDGQDGPHGRRHTILPKTLRNATAANWERVLGVELDTLGGV